MSEEYNPHSEQLILRLEKGEELMSTLKGFCEQTGVEGGWVSGLGAASRATLSAYNLDTKKYTERTFEGKFEIANLVGNIARLGDDTVLHIHATLSNDKMEAFGGHVTRLTIAATCEIFLTTTRRIERQFDKEIGLNLISG